jgi:biotin carboxyl carrier protein
VRFTFYIDGRAREVAASASGEIAVDGVGATIKVEAPASDRRVVQVNGKTHEIWVVESRCDSGEFLLELAGERILVKAADVVKGSPAPGGSGTGAVGADVTVSEASGAGSEAVPAAAEVKNGVWAPMPGKILRVLVKPGQAVKEGDPVVVLEAMKMENELRSPITGTVKAVHVADGDQAGAGQLLVELA